MRQKDKETEKQSARLTNRQTKQRNRKSDQTKMQTANRQNQSYRKAVKD